MTARDSLIKGSGGDWPLCDAGDNTQSVIVDRANFRSMVDMSRVSRCYLPDAYDVTPGRAIAVAIRRASTREDA